MTIGTAILSRKSVKAFASTPIPEKTLAEILRLTQRAPTALNLQSYTSVIVRDQARREELAEAMLHSNIKRVKEAPVVAVFASDIEPTLSVPRIQELLRESGVPESILEYLPKAARMFSQHELPADAPVPLDAPTVAWSFKQTSLAVATMLYAAEELGVSSCPMEGFVEAKVREVLEIPERYKVPVIVALGYPKEDVSVFRTPRLPPTEVFFDGKFGQSSAEIFKA